MRSRAINAILTTNSQSLSFFAAGWPGRAVVVLSFPAIFLDPPERTLELLLVVNHFIDPADELRHIDAFVRHAEVALEEIPLTAEPAIPIGHCRTRGTTCRSWWRQPGAAADEGSIFCRTSAGMCFVAGPARPGRKCRRREGLFGCGRPARRPDKPRRAVRCH